jgi:hypothetical protein
MNLQFGAYFVRLRPTGCALFQDIEKTNGNRKISGMELA